METLETTETTDGHERVFTYAGFVALAQGSANHYTDADSGKDQFPFAD